MGKGRLIIISGPSGVGKGTVCSLLLKIRKDLIKSVSVTTRSPRPGETEGVNYFFKTIEEYNEIKKAGGLLETFEIYGNYYGTPLKFVLDTINSGINILLEIDVQGALAVKVKMPEAKLIFLAPPDIEQLRERLKNRNTEDAASFKKRIESAENEIRQKEKYDFIVVNDSVERAVNEISDIIDKFSV